jgi:hypothetical protein
MFRVVRLANQSLSRHPGGLLIPRGPHPPSLAPQPVRRRPERGCRVCSAKSGSRARVSKDEGGRCRGGLALRDASQRHRQGASADRPQRRCDAPQRKTVQISLLGEKPHRHTRVDRRTPRRNRSFQPNKLSSLKFFPVGFVWPTCTRVSAWSEATIASLPILNGVFRGLSLPAGVAGYRYCAAIKYSCGRRVACYHSIRRESLKHIFG